MARGALALAHDGAPGSSAEPWAACLPWSLSEAPPEVADSAAFDHLGKDAKPGVTVYRFANRIPLLFEGGGDVATQVSKRRINWAAYKMRHNLDKIGVFVSLVSTKVPFKGTGKEYIGDDIPEVLRPLTSPYTPLHTLTHPYIPSHPHTPPCRCKRRSSVPSSAAACSSRLRSPGR